MVNLPRCVSFRLQHSGLVIHIYTWALPGVSVGKESVYHAGDTGGACPIPRSGRSPGGGHGNPLQYSCWGNPKEEPGGLQFMGRPRVRHG